ncbi:ATP-binding protein [Chondromyces crocatus]|nr:ATP-binding protein [Chondromyces crocatus]
MRRSERVDEVDGGRHGKRVAERRRGRTEAAAYGARMAALQEATARLAAVIDPDEVGPALAREAWYAMEPAIAAVYIVEEGGSTLRMAGALGVDEEAARRFADVPLDSDTPVGEAFRTGAAVTYKRSESAGRSPAGEADGLLTSEFETFLALPLRMDDRAHGVLALAWDRPEGFDEVTSELARLAAQAGTMALERVQLFASERAARARAEAARERLSVLARVGEVLAGSLDYHKTIASVVELCVPRLADWAAVDMLNEDGTLSRLGVAHTDPVRVALARELWHRYPPRMDSPYGIPAVVRTGVPEIVLEIPPGMLEERLPDPELLALYRWLGYRSSICLPLRVRGRTVGALSLLTAESDRRFGPEDVNLAHEVARRASLAIERAHSFREAQELSRHKDEFMATISHELRTPLNAIVGWTRMLLGGRLPPDRQRHALEVIARNADLQTQLISDLLDVSRAISGKLRLQVGVVDVRGVLTAALESVRPFALGRDVELSEEFSEDPGPVAGDAGRLQQVVWNLLTNAIKFSPAGGKVSMSLRSAEGWVEVEVRDWGEGMQPEFLPFVFEQFRQADASRARRHGGLGLGLAICRTLVELHGGTVAAHSEGLGKGSTFTVRLPLATVRPDDRPRTPALQERPETADGPTVESTASPLLGARLLVVEDEPDARELLATLLEQNGATVHAVGSAREAFEAMPAFVPMLIVSDLGMPEEDGLSFIRRVRALPPEQGGGTPALALTAFAREQERGAALAAGFQAHVSKPVDPEMLVAELARWLADA